MQVKSTAAESSALRHETKRFVKAIKTQLADGYETKRLQTALAEAHKRQANSQWPASGTPCIVLPHDVGLTEKGFVAIPNGHKTFHAVSPRYIAPVEDAAASLKAIQDSMRSLREEDLGSEPEYLPGWYEYSSNVLTRLTPAERTTARRKRFTQKASNATMGVLTLPLRGAVWATKGIVRRWAARAEARRASVGPSEG